MQYAPTWGFADAGADARAPASDGRLGTGTPTAKGSTLDLLVDDEIEDYRSAGRSVPRAVLDDLGPQLKGSEMKAAHAERHAIMAGGRAARGAARSTRRPPPGTPCPRCAATPGGLGRRCKAFFSVYHVRATNVSFGSQARVSVGAAGRLARAELRLARARASA